MIYGKAVPEAIATVTHRLLPMIYERKSIPKINRFTRISEHSKGYYVYIEQPSTHFFLLISFQFFPYFLILQD